MQLDDSVRRMARDVIAGFDRAADLYCGLSGGWELHKAPEYYCTVKVAEQLADRKGRYATLEQNITETLVWSGGGKSEERTADLPDQGRFDIAVWGPGLTGILGIVEIKEVKFVTYANVKRDVKRVCNALTQTKKLQWGMVALYASLWDGDAKAGEPKSGLERLETRTGIIEERARAHAAEKNLTCSRFTGCPRRLDDEYAGGIGRADVLAFHS